MRMGLLTTKPELSSIEVNSQKENSCGASDNEGSSQQHKVILYRNPLDSPGGSCSRASNHASPMRNLSSAHGGLYVSAPGKIILFGEHAVVYGRTAIAGSIDLRTYVSLFTSADGRIYLCLPDLNVEKTWLLKDLIKAADRLAGESCLDILAVKATVRFKLPSCVGLGSSGAYCVCIATALLQTTGLIPSPSIVVSIESRNLSVHIF
ncbi:hypothetical protein DICVIV_08069 [Dictyocaulus viviparus]|uniref:Uncharacterized protein n=1 Tax=Dictyocaulus viviparus TaxID=29172 RepID=A0A0D8XMW7_DICVI|nr:hypothetical protein DICVIV_08069 [Dictyocaulus viviparus]